MIIGSAAVMGNAHEAGRALLERLYLQHIGPSMPQILTGEWGKPFFAEGNVHFSISHTKKHVFCVLHERPVGMDAEELDRQIDLRLAQKILSPVEKAQYDAAADKRLALLTFWVLKEARAKATGRGLQGYPSDTEFTLDDPRVQIMYHCLVAVVEEI